MTEKIIAHTVIEVVGFPQDYVNETLQNLLKKIQDDPEIKVTHKEVSTAIQAKEVFSTFAELDVEFKSVTHLIGFCYDYTPSSIEVSEPEHHSLSAFQLTGLLNDLLARLHQYEMLLKTFQARNLVLNKKLENLQKGKKS